ncbi:MAG: hypothetical protein EXX96DRAFT_462104, partial [Benjaminiella poitrasii]
IGMVKEKLAQTLGYIPVFFFLVLLFGTRDYSGPYSNVEKGLLLLYQLLTGASIADMQQVHRLDCIALDGGYNSVVEQVVTETQHLSLRNFCYPIRKQQGVPLTSSETLYNKMFGSLRSRVEATFGELVTTFHKFSHEVPVRVTTIDTFEVQFQLACLLLNIKTFVKMLNIQPLPHQSLWLQTGFDYP